MSTTTYMLLVLPTPGSTNDFTGEQQLIAALNSIDAHDHSSGKGTPVHVAGLLIDADLPFGGFNATGLRTVRLSSLASVPALLTDINCLADSGGNLYWINASGQAVQITSGSTLSATSLGGISGLGSPASASFGSSTFTWRSNTNVAATLDGGPIIIRDVGASALGITIASPISLAVGYSITLPATLPGSTVLLQMSSGGVLSASQTVSSPIAISGSTPTAPSMLNSWVAGSGLAYWKDAVGMVHLKGTVTTPGSGGNEAFLLPAGFRPSANRWYVCAETSGLAALNFEVAGVGTPGGVFALGTPTSGTYDLSCVHFLAEA